MSHPAMRKALITSLIALTSFANPLPAHAGCNTTINGTEICVLRVTSNRQTPWMNRAYFSINGTEFFERVVDCSDRTFINHQGQWESFSEGSTFNTVCTDWSF